MSLSSITDVLQNYIIDAHDFMCIHMCNKSIKPIVTIASIQLLVVVSPNGF